MGDGELWKRQAGSGEALSWGWGLLVSGTPGSPGGSYLLRGGSAGVGSSGGLRISAFSCEQAAPNPAVCMGQHSRKRQKYLSGLALEGAKGSQNRIFGT